MTGLWAETERRALERVRRAEAVRLLLRRELRRLPQRLLAPLIGIDRSSLRKFLALAEPQRDTWRRLEEWTRDRPEAPTPLGAVALAILASELPAPHRLRARRRLAEALMRQYVELDRQPPPWLVEEMADGRNKPPGQAI